MDQGKRVWELMYRVSTDSVGDCLKGQHTQSEGGDDLIQCTTDLFDDQSQLGWKADGSLSGSKSKFAFSASRASESRPDLGGSTDNGGVDRGNVRFVDGIDSRCILASSVGLQSRRGSV